MKTKQLRNIILIALFAAFSIKTQAQQIGLLMDGFIVERWKKDRDLFIGKVESMGGTVQLKTANGNADEQFNQAKELLAAGVKVLVVVPVNSASAKAIVEAAHAAGAKVISYDRVITGCKVDYYVGYDAVKIGELQAKFITDNVPSGNIAILSGDESDSNAALIKKGQMNLLKPLIDAGKYKLVFESAISGWSELGALMKMSGYLLQGTNKVDAILAANDAIAGGAAGALKECKASCTPLITGQDAELSALKRILAGTQSITIYKSVKAQANAAAELAMQLAKGESPSCNGSLNNGTAEIKAILLIPVVVNKDNIRNTVVADGFHTEAAIFN